MNVRAYLCGSIHFDVHSVFTEVSFFGNWWCGGVARMRTPCPVSEGKQRRA